MRCLNVAIWLFVAVLPTAAATAQPQDPAGEVDQNPERRKILQLIFQTNDAIAQEQFLQAAELFDGAWELAMRNEDPLLTINTDVEDQLAPGEHRVRPFTFTPTRRRHRPRPLSPACLRALGTHHLLPHAHTLTRTPPSTLHTRHDTTQRQGPDKYCCLWDLQSQVENQNCSVTVTR